MLKIKEILNDVVKYTYGEDCNPRYYKFYVEISDKNYKSKNGHYEHVGNKIVIFNTYREDENIIKTTIHELAHHIDVCNRGRSGHDDIFYQVYAELLYKALDMNLFHMEKFADCEVDSNDRAKVERILENYRPTHVNYKNDKKVISVYNSFKYKDCLKKNGYQYNTNLKCWEKEIEDVESECNKLKRLEGVEIKINDANELHFNGKIKVIAEGNTYQHKEKLKAIGFRYGKKKWVYEAISKEDAKRVVDLFRNEADITLKIDKVRI